MSKSEISSTRKKAAYVKWALFVLKWKGNDTAKAFGLHPATISKIKNGRLYRTVVAAPFPGAPERPESRGEGVADLPSEGRHDA